MVSTIHTFNYQTITCFHVHLVRHLFFFMKTTFYDLCYRKKKYATKLIDAKRKFIELMIRKQLYFC